MKLLLDTHILIWYLEGDSRLSTKLRGIIQDARTELWLCPISIWEILLLGKKGRINFHPDPKSWAETALKKLPLREAPITSQVVFTSQELALAHEDPADRFIAATALVYGLDLASADERLKGLKRLRVTSQ